jgi:hypothetical protein
MYYLKTAMYMILKPILVLCGIEGNVHVTGPLKIKERNSTGI